MSDHVAMLARAGDSGEGQAEGWTPDQHNAALVRYLLYICAIVSALTITWRVVHVLVRYVRTVTCLTNDTQRYFAKASPKFSWLKKNLLYAPLISKRHNREFQLSSAVNVGTLPTRLQFFFLLAYLATNVAFCIINVPLAANFPDAARQIRNRTGTLSVVNMIPLFIMAGRNNPLCALLGVSFDTFNLMHRWFGRIVVLEGLAHVLAYWLGSAYTTNFMTAFSKSWKVQPFLPGFIVSLPPDGHNHPT